MPPSLLSIDLLELVIELALIWAVVYFTVRFLQGTRGAGIVKGFAVLLAAFVLLQLLGLGTERFARLNFIIDYFVGLVAILLIVIFQPELRQATMRLGQARLLRSGRRYEYDARVDVIAEAVSFLSRSRFGAIIAIERNIRLGSLIEGGQPLDAKLNPSLLESIFWPNSPLHDLGVVIRGERVLAAGVQFPLAEEGTLPTKYGSRHRAAVGLSAESDCLVVVVSEETGIISLADGGHLESPIAVDKLTEALRRSLTDLDEQEPPAVEGQTS
ncbi:MAG TPA: TIGR00159 family protein [Phycisphaerales bacterium]|nr:TIGR00159 family protein [Phycisphaerales bacterium]